jgi:hypothetical protein
MDWLTWVLIAVCINWLTPLFFSWAYILFAWIPGWIRFYKFQHGVVFFELREEEFGWAHWYMKLWQDWAGAAVMGASILRDTIEEKPRYTVTMVHEGRHSLQIFILGLLQPIAYVSHSVFIFLFQKDKHAYHDNWFERDARRAAGQLVEIPRDRWMHGRSDRWSWW